MRGIGPDAGLVALSSGEIGSAMRLGLSGTPGAVITTLASPFLGTPRSVTGVGGTLHLDPLLIVALPSVTLDAGGAAGFDLTIPNDPNLQGQSLHLQAVQSASSSWTLGNLQSVAFR